MPSRSPTTFICREMPVLNHPSCLPSRSHRGIIVMRDHVCLPPKRRPVRQSPIQPQIRLSSTEARVCVPNANQVRLKPDLFNPHPNSTCLVRGRVFQPVRLMQGSLVFPSRHPYDAVHRERNKIKNREVSKHADKRGAQCGNVTKRRPIRHPKEIMPRSPVYTPSP